MSWFMNPFVKQIDFNWVLGDRQHCPKFVIPPNYGRGEEIVTVWAQGPYNLSGNDAEGDPSEILHIIYAKREQKNWAKLSIDISATAASAAAVVAEEIASALRANATFNEMFSAETNTFFDAKDAGSGNIRNRLSIRQKQPATQFWFYIQPGQAEEKLQFNYKAGIAEAPVYFERHQLNIDNTSRFDFPDAINAVYLLDTTDNVHEDVVDNARDREGKLLGYTGATVQEDWELLRGKSGIFNFVKNTVDGSNRVTESIEYPAGALVGDLAKKTEYTYTGANTNPDQITEIPYTLESGDLVTP